MKTLLKDAGACVTATDTLTACIAAFENERPNVLISDIELPDGNGFQLLDKLQNLSRKALKRP
ncbi:MAG: response regulator [Chitinophagaceae bacterium]|nr:response regulator [Oligoflexus sp.]